AAGVSTSAIDVSSAVTAALYADRATERVWQAEQTTLASQTTALTAIQAATTALSTDLDSLNSLSGPLAARIVTSSNSSTVTATAAAGTTAGNHSVVVTNLATTASWYSDLASSATATLPASSFMITTKAGISTTITVGSGINTLNQVASSINSQKLGVTATVVSDSTGSRLAIISDASGNASDFNITCAPSTGTSWSSPVVGSGETLGENEITLTMGDTTTTISTTAGETLDEVAADISGQNLGLAASVVSDTDGSRLVIASSDGSTPFTISEPSFGYSQAAVGGNASLTVDGVPISSASNTVTGAINGVTLHLLGTTLAASPVSLAVTADATQISASINQFVTDYNTTIGLVNAQFSYSGSTSSQGVLGADPTIRVLQNSLMQSLNYFNTPSSGTTTISNLTSLGITQNTDGTLTIDSTTLNAALANNAADVQGLFQGTSLDGLAASMSARLDDFTNPGTGAFTVDLNSIAATNTSLIKEISDFETNYIANQKTILTAMYSKAEIALQQLPTELAQIQAELGNNSKSNS
ncbi:MAG: flagellar filament capping protein FliD, partial [Acidobacteriaceae bacterium]|nr:flagellar filament capping protein FliD [Acidobacteriaceae bacterium]